MITFEGKAVSLIAAHKQWVTIQFHGGSQIRVVPESTLEGTEDRWEVHRAIARCAALTRQIERITKPNYEQL